MLSTLASHLSGRPRRTLAITLLFVIIAGVVGGPVAGSLQSSGGFAPGSSDSQRAQARLRHAIGADPTPAITLLVRTPQGATSAAGQAAVAAAARRLAAVAGIQRVVAGPVAPSGTEAYVLATVAATTSDAHAADRVLSAFNGDHGVVVGGDAVASRQISTTVSKDLGIAEALVAPLLIILSILFFRGRAAVMPVVVGVTTVLGTFLVLRGVNEFYGLSIFALNLVIGMGLGLAVDYTLFIVTRYRQELATGADVPTAIATTMRYAGRTVIFSAVTVACALTTLVVFPQGFLQSMGIAGAIVALVAAASAVLISPALLALWGVKLARRETSGQAAAAGRWYRLSHAVMRRPGAIAVLAGAVMIAAASPALSASWSPANDPSVIPRGDSARVVADALTRDFGSAAQSAVVAAIEAPSGAGAAVSRFATTVSHLPDVTRVSVPRYVGDDTWRLTVAVTGDPSGPMARQVVTTMRATATPWRVLVGGAAATFIDQQNAIGSHLALAIGLLALLTFLVLWLMTGSVVLPLKALIMNALTVGVALSALVVIYQHGRLTGLLRYTPDGGVEPTDFVVAATVVFALSTDYGVFLLGAIKEARETALARGGAVDEREVVAAGLGATGQVVTCAAILLAVAIGAFATSQISFIQEIGVAVGLGVLVDAFIVRSLLVPSLMALLGRWNWWSPRPVRLLHRRLARERGRPVTV